jgi:hypothetical protein
MDSDIERRLDAIEARFAISELRSKYCWYTTRGMVDDVVRLFTEDGVFENWRKPGGQPAIVRGSEALRDYLSVMKPARRMPMVMNEVTHVEGNRAEGTCVMHSLGEDSFCGHYIDECKKIGGYWAFSVRRFFPYWPQYIPSADRHDP